MRGQGAAVQKEDRPQPFGPPIEITESQLPDVDIVLARQDDAAEGEARPDGSCLEVVAIFVGR